MKRSVSVFIDVTHTTENKTKEPTENDQLHEQGVVG